MKSFKLFRVVTGLLMLALLAAASVHAGTTINDADALTGHRQGKIIFDINLTDAQKTVLYLDVIKQTAVDLQKQSITPDIVLAFRGLAVTIIQKDDPNRNSEQQQIAGMIAGRIAELQEMGVKMEACSVATNLFKVDNANILPGIKVVGNTFVSLMGYQGQGYAIIPIM